MSFLDDLKRIGGELYDDSVEYLLSEQQARNEYKKAKVENPSVVTTQSPTNIPNYMPFYFMGGGLVLVLILAILLKK